MHSVANKLAQYGRGGDDTLVHMNQAEVAGLNALNHLVNNRPLSKNPVTGMTEAMDLTDILAGLGIGVAAALTGGAAAAAAPMLLGATAGAAGGAGALGLGALAGAATGAGLNAGKAAIKGDQDIGMAAAFGAGSGALGGLGGAAGAGNAAVAEGAGNVAAQNISTVAKDAITPGLSDSAAQGLGSLAPTTTPTNILGDTSKFLSSDIVNSGAVPPVENAGFAGLPADLAKSDQIMANAGKFTGAAPVNFTNAPADLAKPSEIPTVEKVPVTGESMSYNALDVNHTGLPYANPNLANPNPSFGDAMSQSFEGLKNTVMNPGQHQGLFAAQLGAAGLEDQYKQQGLTARTDAKQAAALMQQYKNAGVLPSSMPQFMIDAANKPQGFAAGGTIRDVQGLGAIPSGYINQQSMSNFYPQSMIPQAQPLQSTQPIRHEVIGYADGGQVGYGYAEGGDIGGGDEGLLHGPGTGQSDGIAGLIEGEQGQEPVRLADGEFVVPADVVSALGDGSTKAGAQALYDMLDRIRQQAYGHLQQANPVEPQAVMPV
jgi:hypothetical protein